MKNYTLRHPIKKATGETVSAIDIRYPTIGDVITAKRAQKTDLVEEAEVFMISQLTGLSTADVMGIALADFNTIQELVTSFLQPSPSQV